MRKRVSALLFALLATFTVAFAQSGTSLSRIFESDGTFWTSTEKVDKLLFATGYMIGFYESSKILFERIDKIDGNKVEIEKFASLLNNVSPGMLINAVDIFYTDKKNLKIIVGEAFFASMEKIKKEQK
jgi:hypothetical protein